MHSSELNCTALLWNGGCCGADGGQTTEEDNNLKHDIFFWLGAESTIDERGVAAYKTVELDDFLGGTPVEHRVVQGGETKGFLGCFDKPPIIMHGGIESGFTHVKIEEYKPRLLHVKGKVPPCTGWLGA